MKIVALAGSLRDHSYNLCLVKTIQQRYQELFSLQILDIGILPFYNEDDENDPPEQVVHFKQCISQADGVIIATPEYNWSIPGVLKNALDWLSRVDKVFINKPVMIVGVSTGMVGTLRAQQHLRQVLASPGLCARVLPAAGNEVLINFAKQKFDESGQLIEESAIMFLDDVMQRFVKWVSHESFTL
jgi:chromate reductase